MKMADVLRGIADKLDGNSDEHHGDDMGVPHEEHENPNTMIPPLQQKIELLKKASGLANAFDDGVGHSGVENPADVADELTHGGEHDELDDIKRIAGLTVMIDGPQGEMG